ncbi:glycosyltransferase family 2 protein [Sphingobacterium gobiense]|uniref:Glycosyl transferase family A n=1 Tax=Sphingobacterium gobiense TaxID=1382456 RepID=A0A2S9JTA3_9SPHI|nr:glycosyltransferase family 2 protein [Sphingobacterium gobiense]PRD56484.1 glycosyl transferase family A [Sphingobacterium gobiense]
MSKALVSIIIPVYNAADTLHVCLVSLERQSYDKLELIFVDDCSTDASVQLIEKFQEKLAKQTSSMVKLLRHAENQGVAAARNIGLDAATGDYLYYVDADDWLAPQAIELMLEEAERNDAEIVGCDWYLSFSKNERLMRQPTISIPEEGIRHFINGKMRWNLWLFLVKRSLYEDHQLRFIPKLNMGEDMMMMFKLFSLAKKVNHLPQALYHYGQSNEASLTKSYTDEHIEQVVQNVNEIAHFLGEQKKEAVSSLDLLKLIIKLPMLISDDRRQYEKWRNWFSEANGYAWNNKEQSLRIRLIQWAAWKKQDWLLKLHYYLIIRVVYGLFYT